MNTIFLSTRFRPSRSRRAASLLFVAALVVTCIGHLRADEAPSAKLSPEAPLSGFRLPTFTNEGHRSMLIESTEAVIGKTQIELTNLNLTLFDGSAANAIETILLSPQATAFPETEIISGPGPVRLIRDEVEITGEGWRYEHAQRKVSIAKNTRIRFLAPLPDLLK